MKPRKINPTLTSANPKKDESDEGYIQLVSMGGSSDDEDPLFKKGIYYIVGEVEPGLLTAIQKDILLKHLDPQWNGDVQLFINTMGGDVAATWALIDLLDWVRMDVRTIGLGECWSAGACLLACGTKGKRFCSKNSSVMIHGANFQGLGGNRSEILANLKDVDNEHNKDVEFWIQHSKYKTSKAIESKFLDGKDHYMTAKEALAHGIIDEIIKGKIK